MGIEIEEPDRVECECGLKIMEKNMEIHLKSKRHDSLLNKSPKKVSLLCFRDFQDNFFRRVH